MELGRQLDIVVYSFQLDGIGSEKRCDEHEGDFGKSGRWQNKEIELPYEENAIAGNVNETKLSAGNHWKQQRYESTRYLAQ